VHGVGGVPLRKRVVYVVSPEQFFFCFAAQRGCDLCVITEVRHRLMEALGDDRELPGGIDDDV
jgi:hypothetical protein